MRAGRMTRHIHPVRVAAETGGILHRPLHRPPAILDHLSQRQRFHTAEVRRGIGRPARNEGRGRIGCILASVSGPGTAMDEDQDRGGLGIPGANTSMRSLASGPYFAERGGIARRTSALAMPSPSSSSAIRGAQNDWSYAVSSCSCV